MSKHRPTSLPAKQLFSCAAFFARVALHSFVLFMVIVSACATPCFGPLTVTAESPVDQDESTEVEAINVQGRARVGHEQPGSPLLSPSHGGPSQTTANFASVPKSGHRLPNNLLAPLRC